MTSLIQIKQLNVLQQAAQSSWIFHEYNALNIAVFSLMYVHYIIY